MNKKILSFIFGSLLVFSLFGAIEFQEVAAAETWAVALTSATSGTAYFNSGSMPMNFTVKITYNSVTTTDKLTEVTIAVPTIPAGYVLDNLGSQPSAPSGWAIDYASPAGQINYNHSTGVSGSGTITFTVKLVGAPGADTTGDAWTITDGGSTSTLPTLSPNTFVDNTPPEFELRYIKSPKVDNGIGVNDILGLGTVTIQLFTDEPVAPTSSTSDRPVVKVKQINKTETAVTMTSQSASYPDSIFTGSYSITSTSGASDGLATVTVSAKDRAGNIGTTINWATYDGPSFIVDSQCPVPTLNSPINGASSSSSSVTFVWEKIPDGANKNVTYTLQYSTSSTFSSNVVTVAGVFDDDTNTPLSGAAWTVPSASTRAYTTSLVPGTYYWKVKAADTLNNESLYSAVWSITVTSSDTTPPNYRVRFIKTPKIDYNTTPDVLGSGSLSIRIHASETLKRNPTVQVRLHNQTTWTSLSVTPTTAASIYTATYTVPTGTTNNGLAQISISGEDLQGNVGTDINASRWYGIHNTSPYPTSEEDSDGGIFYVDTATDSPSLYNPPNGHVIPFNQNEANFTFYKITDISAERPADLGQNNCLTYHVQYSTSSTFSTNVVTQSVDVNESTAAPVFCATGTNAPYNRWDVVVAPFANLRRHRSQALSNGTWYWRVWATDKLGNQSPYSETRTFSVSTVTPNLFAPADLSLLTINNPRLQWKDVCSSVWYNIRLSRADENFLDYTLYPNDIAVNTFQKSNDANNTNFITEGSTNVWIIDYNVSTSTPPNPAIGHLEDGVWYWKVASNLDSTSYSPVWRFTVDSTGPPSTTLILPGNGEVSQNKRPSFTWAAVNDINNLSDPVRYYIQISGDPTFPNAPGPANSTFIGTNTWPSSSIYNPDWLNKTYQRGPLTVNNFTPFSDFPETPETNSSAYYWRVYAVDSAGNVGPNSLVHVLKVDTTPPLKWGTDPDGNDSCEDYPGGCETSVAQTDYLALQLRSPSNGIIIQARNPTLEWRHSVCPCVKNQVSSYIVQYSTDITFPAGSTTETAGVFQVTGISYEESLINMGYTIQNSLYNGTYFWRVSAVDTAGNRTQFTAPWSFTINIPGNESTPQCSTTVPCPSGYNCQSGVCVPIVMSPGNLTLTVQNAGGTAIAGATVTVDGVAQVTDAAGQVTYTALSGGSHTLNNVTASGYNDYGTSTISVNGNTAQTITMTVPGTEGYIWGTVYFDAIGTAAPNVLIDIYNQSTDVKVDSRLTNSEGKFQSSPLPSTGTYYAKIPAYEKELRDLQPTSLTTGEKIVILETKGTVTGIVQDDSGQIVSSATVVLKKYPGEEFVDTKTTNSIGQFSFDALPGTYVVTISKAGYDAYTSSSFSVQSKQTVNLQSVLGNIVLNSIRGTLTVSVKDDKGATINTATVTIRSSTGAVVRSITTSGGTGSTQLAPGAYRVSAVSSGFAESLQQSTNITSNQTSSVSITLAPATGSIRVVAKDASGAPLAGASVYVDGTLSGITDSEGELLVTGLKLGTHTVRITKGGFTAVEEQVTSGDSTVIVDTALRKNNLPLYLGIGLGLLILAGALYYFKFGKQQGPKRPPMSKGLTLPSRPGAPKLRPHRHKGGLPPSSIRVKKKNL